MASWPTPTAKRRKVSSEDDQGAFPVSLPDGYLTLAEGSVIVASVTNTHTATGQSYPVGIKSVQIDGQQRCVLFFSTPSRQTPSPSTAQLQSCSSNEETVQLLQDCAKLEPIWKIKKTANSSPGACVHATLSFLRHEYLSTKPYRYQLTVSILWPNSPRPRDRINASALEILDRYQRSNECSLRDTAEVWDPSQFYENVHVPEKNEQNSADLQIDLLQSQLFPFQRRAVRWLLKREGFTVDAAGRLVAIQEDPEALPIGFECATDRTDEDYFYHPGLGVATTDFAALKAYYVDVKGGILAEEMGLGKTVELLALLCLHPRPDMLESADSDGLHKSRATLIITPPTILEQWKQEIEKHAPSLKVLHYEGVKSGKRGLTVHDLADNDIVLTTYNVIAKEVHYVVERPERNLRRASRYEPPESLLKQISWWRVCLDEAQMVESGVSAAARVAQLIPRINAWAVSGTPLRRDHKDIFGLLLFLRYQPWCHSVRVWNRLVDFHRPLFRCLISDVAIRHGKDLVREDLRLPPQARHVINLPFSAIEEQNYSQLFQQMYEDCGLDANGDPVTDDWDPEAPAVVEKMRMWLTRLRQTCLHPEVGHRNRRALGRSEGPLRSVLQVLDVMIDQNEVLVRAEQREKMVSQIQRGQMLENAKETRAAMQLWQEVYDHVSKVVNESRAQYEAEVEVQKANGKADNVEEGVEAEKDSRLTVLRQRLRSDLEIRHVCIFFIANANFQLKANEPADSDEHKQLERQEEAAYEEAKAIRAELLTEVLKKSNRLIDAVKKKDGQEKLNLIPGLHMPLDHHGIESRKAFDKLRAYCESMNRQAEYFLQLRQKMIDFLKQSLVDEDDGVEIKGDEYEKSTKLQDEIYAYMEALRATFADRSDALSGQENTLIRHEMKSALKAAREGDGPAPEVMIRLLSEREQYRIPPDQGSLRGIVSDIRSLKTALEWQDGGRSTRARAELAIVDGILQHTQKLIAEQNKSITALEQEVNLFRETMNSRLDYYRALQKISDTVAPFEEHLNGLPLNPYEIAVKLVAEGHSDHRLSRYLARRRYLLHLKTESSSSQTARVCTICQCEFEIGTLTVCGHHFCKDCLRIWFSERRNCPVCKRGLKSSEFWDITYKPAEMTVVEEETAPSPIALNSSDASSSRSLDKSIYSDISTSTLNEIKDIDLDGSSFGSKVDTICRHLVWLRYHDPGSKAIIFSQFREFLDVLGRAFKQHKIAFTRFDDKNGIERFKTDPAVESFLLHAKAASAGLNLVVANHVFLCEPLINTAIELQAIARVHRIGQHRATTVWMYLVSDTVEEAIYDISVQRRLAHLRGKGKGKTSTSTSSSGTATPAIESAIEAANSKELQSADLSKMLTNGKSGGEMVDKQDLWRCLFGKVGHDSSDREREMKVRRARQPLREWGQGGHQQHQEQDQQEEEQQQEDQVDDGLDLTREERQTIENFVAAARRRRGEGSGGGVAGGGSVGAAGPS